MWRYHCIAEGHRFSPVTAENTAEAVQVFADRLAVKVYGRGGRAADAREIGYDDKTHASRWLVLVGKRVPGGIVGGDVTFHLERKKKT